MYLYRYAAGLAEQTENSLVLATDVAESAELRELGEKGGITLRVYGKSIGKGPSIWRYAAFLKKLTEETKPDIFWEPNNLLPIHFRNPYGKYVVTIHDVFPVTMPECYGRIYPPYFRYGVKRTLGCCDAVLYISETARGEVEKHFPTAASREHLVGYIIVPPVAKQAEDRKDYFFYVGNLERRKGTDLLLAAYEKYLAAGGTRGLYLAGKVREVEIQRQIDALEAKTDKLRYLGYIDEDERDRRYAECRAFVFPSRAEGFGIPVIEALSCGTEVLASDLPVFREIAGDALQYFELDENEDVSAARLTEAMMGWKREASDDRREQRRQCAERYTPERLVPRVMSFFEELLA